MLLHYVLKAIKYSMAKFLFILTVPRFDITNLIQMKNSTTIKHFDLYLNHLSSFFSRSDTILLPIICPITAKPIKRGMVIRGVLR